MSAKATKAFHWPDPVNGGFYDKGDPVPDEVAAQVDRSLVSGYEPAEDGGDPVTVDSIEAKARELIEAGDYLASSEVQDKVDEAVQAYRDREQAAYDALADTDTPFDPSGDGVKATDVKSYLEGLDTGTVNGQAEYERVVELEREGANRSSAIPTAD